jgi:hypothetical protein
VAKHVFIIITQPPSRAESEAFEQWYVGRHIPDVLAVPGMVKARRYRLPEDPKTPAEPLKSVTIYEMETDDRDAVMAEIRRRAGSDAMPLYSGTAGGAHVSYLGEAVTGELLA